MTSRPKRPPQGWSKLAQRVVSILLMGLTACSAALPMPHLRQPDTQTQPRAGLARDTQPPVFAYYYIWFDPTTWEHAKQDYPLLGRYASDDRQIMRQHIRWAKLAGIDGFIVSWKSTDKLNARLEKLAEIAVQEAFSLAIIYQGLDVEREPIAVEKVDVDLDYFTTRYRHHPAFAHFARPLVIWSGTWGFTREEIAMVARHHRRKLLLLASERNQRGYARIADLVAGNAYYWSSVNPATYPNYPGKLIDFGRDVHAHHGIWIAPAAPGFDARLLGGTTVVEREDGALLQQQLQGALQSQPEIIGLISWNEFSENTHIEPSESYGTHYLEVLGGFFGVEQQPFTTSLQPPPDRPPVSYRYSLPVLGALVLLIVLSLSRVVQQVHKSLP